MRQPRMRSGPNFHRHQLATHRLTKLNPVGPRSPIYDRRLSSMFTVWTLIPEPKKETLFDRAIMMSAH